MNQIVEQILNVLSNKYVLIGLIVIIVCLILILVLKRMQSDKLKRELAEYEIRYNSIKSVPLSFKLNKAVAIARVNVETMTTVAHYKDDFDQAQSNLKQIAQLLANIEDNILIGKNKMAKNDLLDLDSLVQIGEKQVNDLNRFLDTILEKETAQRLEVTDLKERFRLLKQQINEKSSSLAFSWLAIESTITDTEKLFTTFEECMYASEFEKATELTVVIRENISKLSTLIDMLPELLQETRGVLPRLIDDVAQSYAAERSRGVYLGHLEIEKNLVLLTDALTEDLDSLRKGNCQNIKENCDDYRLRLSQLTSQIKKESSSFDEMQRHREDLNRLCANTSKLIDSIKTSIEKCGERYGMEDLSKEVELQVEKYKELVVKKDELLSKGVDTYVPASEFMCSVNEVMQDLQDCYQRINEIKEKMETAQSDEERAKKQLLKLQLIMNEIQVKIVKNKLPSISDAYGVDLQKAYDYLKNISRLVEEIPMDVTLLNSTVDESIDFIYKLYNNVNNVVGMVMMVENTIVFGNKYRSTYADIDSELTRAELCFRNGEYTQALTIAIATIEKIHPGCYESLIKENAKSAT